MIERDRTRTGVGVMILLLSSIAWILILAKPLKGICVCYCSVADSGSFSVSFWNLLAKNLNFPLALGWALMIVAMMLPTLVAPILHIMECSFKRRRIRSVLLFVAGYGIIWMAAGGVLFAVRLMLALVAPSPYWPAVMVGLVAFVWQCSPAKQLCLNRNHNHRELAAFGSAADRDVFSFGLTHGIWCVGSGWALMLFPMLLTQGHNLVMFAITFLMISERLNQPDSLRWRLRGPGKLIRILVARARMGSGFSPFVSTS